ncbi:MAG: twin-arginine translocase TatA/TatE family subunit, partial [Alphaproteobacteria bacterium]|nr:twin-arginine translocase TatA/TatE family subunit [Alphaproteobacteria bacterium]
FGSNKIPDMMKNLAGGINVFKKELKDEKKEEAVAPKKTVAAKTASKKSAPKKATAKKPVSKSGAVKKASVKKSAKK